MDKLQYDFYKKMRSGIMDWIKTKKGAENKWAEYLLLAPDLFHLLCKLALDKDVPASYRARLFGAIAYFISPVDLMPEAFLGPVGYLDDIALAAYVLNYVINRADPKIIKKHWAGEGDVLEAVQSILAVADQMIGAGLWKRIRSKS